MAKYFIALLALAAVYAAEGKTHWCVPLHVCIAFTWIRKLVLDVCVCVIAYLGTRVCALRDAKIWFGSARVGTDI